MIRIYDTKLSQFVDYIVTFIAPRTHAFAFKQLSCRNSNFRDLFSDVSANTEQFSVQENPR